MHYIWEGCEIYFNQVIKALKVKVIGIKFKSGTWSKLLGYSNLWPHNFLFPFVFLIHWGSQRLQGTVHNDVSGTIIAVIYHDYLQSLIKFSGVHISMKFSALAILGTISTLLLWRQPDTSQFDRVTSL